jgi:hypothetical protein
VDVESGEAAVVDVGAGEGRGGRGLKLAPEFDQRTTPRKINQRLLLCPGRFVNHCARTLWGAPVRGRPFVSGNPVVEGMAKLSETDALGAAAAGRRSCAGSSRPGGLRSQTEKKGEAIQRAGISGQCRPWRGSSALPEDPARAALTVEEAVAFRRRRGHISC